MAGEQPPRRGGRLPALLRHGSRRRALCFRRRRRFLWPRQKVAEPGRVCLQQGNSSPQAGPNRFYVFPHTCCLLSATSGFVKIPILCPASTICWYWPHRSGVLPLSVWEEPVVFLGTNFSYLKSRNNGLVLTPSHQHTHETNAVSGRLGGGGDRDLIYDNQG